MENDSDLDPLRGEERFKALLVSLQDPGAKAGSA
jgi:hypothetical protein